MTGRLCLILIGICLACGNVLRAEDRPDAPEIVVLVEQLGAASFKARLAAADRLVKIGDAGLKILEAAQQHTDPEVRQRIVRILQQVKADSSRKRLGEFKANPSRETAAKLPGWKQFSAVTGDTNQSAQCFGRMFASEPELFEDHPPQYLAAVVATRVTELERRFATRSKDPIPIDQLHALLITSSQPHIPVSAATARSLMKLVDRPAFIVQLRNPTAAQKPTRDITAHWIASCETVDPYTRLQFAMTTGLKAGLQPALAILKSRAAALQKQIAILAVARLGSIDNVPNLEPLLSDARIIPTAKRTSRGQQKGDAHNGSAPTTQVSDIALAAIWHLHGERPEDHGFLTIRRNPIYVFAINQIRFESDEQRTAATQLWNTFKSTH